MKKSINLFIALVLSAASTQAQSSGAIMFGSNVASSSIATFDKNGTYDMNIQTKFGYFAGNRLAFGLCLETQLNKNETVPFGLTFISRYYTQSNPAQKIKFFVEGGVGLADNMHAHKTSFSEDLYKYTDRKLKFAASMTAGVDIFPKEWIAFEISPEYRYVTGACHVHRLGINAGFKLFLSKKAFLNIFPNKFDSLY